MGDHCAPDWEDKRYPFFQHTECECFPCHPIDSTDDFNCLFCYCPLYALGEACGGDFRYTSAGIKDCSGCVIPHRRGNYGLIRERCERVIALAARPAAQDK